ncbi:MAG TPA: hypothetical protein VI981_01305 [Candidatus Paceibacterota bacterium]
MQDCVFEHCQFFNKHKIWKTITILGILPEELASRPKGSYDLGEFARGLLKHGAFPPSTTRGRINLIVLALEELGFTEPAPWARVIRERFLRRWSKRNLRGLLISHTEPEDAFSLRASYLDQPCDDSQPSNGMHLLKMGMVPLLDLASYPRIFTLERLRTDLPPMIGAHCAGPDCKFGPKEKIVFRIAPIPEAS